MRQAVVCYTRTKMNYIKNALFVSIIVLTSCSLKSNDSLKNEQDVKQKENRTLLKGVIKESYGDSCILIDADEIDSITHRLISNGLFYQNLKTGQLERTGWHTFYNKDLIKTHKVKFGFLSNGESVQLQRIFYDNNGDTIKRLSSYLKLELNLKDSLLFGDTIKLKTYVFHKENSETIKDSYKLKLYNSQLNEEINLSSKQPILNYEYCPKDTGKLVLDGYLYFFLNDENDSIEVVTMSYKREFQIKR